MKFGPISFHDRKSNTAEDSRPRFVQVDHNDAPLRIAIVGCGPKGLYCLESLSRQLHRSPRPATVVVYEAHPYPGAGPVYSLEQPSYLRMNFAAKHIDAWTKRDDRDHQVEPTFLGWVTKCGATVTGNDFVPRAMVGSYLHACWRSVWSNLREQTDLRLVRERVHDVEKGPSGWRIVDSEGPKLFDEVLITVGHEGWRASTKRSNCNGSTNYIGNAFPTDEQLIEANVAPASMVAARGFALTWIDATLALTAGRGGNFSETYGRWTYDRSGREPLKIFPFSRTARPMLSKPDESLLHDYPVLNAVWERGRDRLNLILPKHGLLDFKHDIWPVILLTAGEALDSITAGTAATTTELSCQIKDDFNQWCNASPTAGEAYTMMAESYRVATGERPPNSLWVLGETWRQLYPMIVECVSHDGLKAESKESFRDYAKEMERISFGPPPENLGRMLALIECGIVDLRLLDRVSKVEVITPSTLNEVAGCHIDVVLDATIPAPRNQQPGSVIDHLIENATIEREESGLCGIRVDRAGRPLSSLGSADGLAIIGRVTEGSVLGNDSLSRSLHRHPDYWATSVVNSAKRNDEL